MADVSYPPPPKIDYGAEPAGAKRRRELFDVLDACENLLTLSAVIGVFAKKGWSASGKFHPSPTTFDLTSQNGLRLHFSIREKHGDLTVRVSSMPSRQISV